MLLVSRAMKLLGSVRFTVGVNVAVQVLPPSLVVRLVSSPLVTLRSDRSKSVTASLKVKVTWVVSPTVRFGSATTMVAVGRVASSA
ncbi:hypothetical protein D3C80_1810590 [compost metagenome]